MRRVKFGLPTDDWVKLKANFILAGFAVSEQVQQMLILSYPLLYNHMNTVVRVQYEFVCMCPTLQLHTALRLAHQPKEGADADGAGQSAADPTALTNHARASADACAICAMMRSNDDPFNAVRVCVCA
jgi:hypothetical protein